MTSIAQGELTLGDLLDEPKFGLDLVAGGDEARTRPVVGAHSIEVERPAPWLEAGWIMLTIGLGISDDEDEHRQLIRELADRGVTGMGLAVGMLHPSVPPALLDESRRLGFPLFTVKLGVPFRSIEAAAYRGARSHDACQYHRLVAIQRFLIDALCEPHPAQVVVERFAAMLNVDAAVMRRDGAVDAGSHNLPHSLIGEHLGALTTAVARLEVPDFTGWALALGEYGIKGSAWLVVGARGGRVEHPLTKQAAQLAVPILASLARLDDSRREESAAVRRATLDALLDASDDQAARIAAARASTFGPDVASGTKVAVACTREVADVSGADLTVAIEAALDDAGVACLVGSRGTDAVVLLPGDLSEKELAEALLPVNRLLVVGLGRVADEPLAVHQSHADARLTAHQLSGRPGARVLRYEDLDLGSVLVGAVPADLIQPKVDDILEPLRANPFALKTLVTFLEHDLDVGRTSRALHLHPNSTRYRLARVERLLGLSLRRPSTIAALYFALTTLKYKMGENGPEAGLTEDLELAPAV